ncbi:MAG: ice-binding family protein [Sulfuricaulis sp.]
MNRFENSFKPWRWLLALAAAALMAGCGSSGGGSSSSAGVPASSAAAGPTGAVSTAAGGVPLGAAGYYAILAKAGVSTVPNSVVTGNVGLSPTARVGLTGWSETAAADNSDLYSTSAQVAAPGKLYAADYAEPTPTNLGTAVLNMEAAYTDAAGRPAGVGATNLNRGAGTLTNDTLVAGTYTWNSALNIPTDLTLSGSATDVWIFQVAGTLDMAAAKKVILSGGALPQNIFWQVSGAVTMGAGTHFEGIILGKTGITFGTLASINGRLLAQTAVVLDETTVTVP